MLKSCSKYCEVAILRKEKEMEKKYIDVDAVPGERWVSKGKLRLKRISTNIGAIGVFLLKWIHLKADFTKTSRQRN